MQIARDGAATRPAAKKADPCSLVVFGASGDLTHRLLVPALYNLAAGGLLPDQFTLVGVARSEMSDQAFRDDLRKEAKEFFQLFYHRAPSESELDGLLAPNG